MGITEIELDITVEGTPSALIVISAASYSPGGGTHPFLSTHTTRVSSTDEARDAARFLVNQIEGEGYTVQNLLLTVVPDNI